MWFNFDFNAAFAARNLLFSYPLMTIVPVYVLVVLCSSWAMLVCERTVRVCVGSRARACRDCDSAC